VVERYTADIVDAGSLEAARRIPAGAGKGAPAGPVEATVHAYLASSNSFASRLT
jgi:hypothetical protein